MQNPKSKSAFVTGGTGFIGSHLVEELRRRGYGAVRCLVRSDPKWLAGMDVEVVRGGLSDRTVLEEGVRGVDYVYHVAGATRAPDWDTFRKANVEATLTLLEAVRTANPEVRKVLVTSSLAAVGPCEEGEATEETPLRPVSRYGRSKAEMESALTAPRPDGPPLSEMLPLVVVRPPAVYGPRERDIFGLFQLVRRGVFPRVGPGDEPVLSLVHVRDLVRGMVDAAEEKTPSGTVYFLGSEGSYTWNEVKAAMTVALGRRALTVPVPRALVGAVGAASEVLGDLLGAFDREKARELLETCKRCSVARARRELDYRQQVSLEEGMRETVAWYRREGWL